MDETARNLEGAGEAQAGEEKGAQAPPSSAT
jgi:hypothetical protein